MRTARETPKRVVNHVGFVAFERLRKTLEGTTLCAMRIVCPMCSKVVENAPPDTPFRPFCSPSCKLADLSNWMNETYRISRPLTAEDALDEGPGHADEHYRPDELN